MGHRAPLLRELVATEKIRWLFTNLPLTQIHLPSFYMYGGPLQGAPR